MILPLFLSETQAEAKRNCSAPLKTTYDYFQEVFQQFQSDFQAIFYASKDMPLAVSRFQMVIDEGDCLLTLGSPPHHGQALRVINFQALGRVYPAYIEKETENSTLPDHRALSAETGPHAEAVAGSKWAESYAFVPSMHYWQTIARADPRERYLQISESLLHRELLQLKTSSPNNDTSPTADWKDRLQPFRADDLEIAANNKDFQEARAEVVRHLVEQLTAKGGGISPTVLKARIRAIHAELTRGRTALQDPTRVRFNRTEPAHITLAGLKAYMRLRLTEEVEQKKAQAAQQKDDNAPHKQRTRSLRSRTAAYTPEALRRHMENLDRNGQIGLGLALLLDRINPSWKSQLWRGNLLSLEDALNALLRQP